MRWKRVALAGALGPAAAGCHLPGLADRHPTHDHAPVGLAHDLRADARSAWREVRAEYPRRAFSAEFRDGFLDGYVDYLDRGGEGLLPAVPPARYTQHKKYFTPDGQCLVKEYFLGFKYGQDVAVATGKRQYLTVPVLLPQPAEPPPPAVLAAPPRPAAPTAPPMPVPVPLPPPGSDAPPPAPPVVGAGAKLPAPPPEVPALPDHVPTPPVRDELPIILPTHLEPPIVLPSHPELTGR